MTRYISPWIFTTNQCNLNCGYCYVKRDNTYMSLDTYDKINEIFINMLNNDETDTVIYRLAGGEPLLSFDRWKNPMQKFKDATKDSGFISVISNMTLLNDEMISFFKRNKVGFGISLDGYSFSKPYFTGETSSKAVMSNIDKLISSGITRNIDISTVIDKQSFIDVEKLAQWIAERNLSWGIYLDHFFCGEINSDVIIEKMITIVDILQKYDYDLYNKLKFNNIKINHNYEGCTAGEKLITIDVNGSVFPCQTTIYEEPICSIFDCKNIIDELKRQKKYKIGYNHVLPNECVNCSISDICGGGCKINNKEINKNYTCDIMKAVLLYIAKKSLKRMEEN